MKCMSQYSFTKLTEYIDVAFGAQFRVLEIEIGVKISPHNFKLCKANFQIEFPNTPQIHFFLKSNHSSNN